MHGAKLVILEIVFGDAGEEVKEKLIRIIGI
jgi:hypothetical protein